MKGAADDVVLGNLTSLLARIKPAVVGVPADGKPRTSKNLKFVDDVGRLNVILAVAPRHRLKSRPRGHECAALRGAVVDSPALSSGQAQNVRREGAREKVCCLPTRMVSSVLDHEVP